MSEGGYRVKLRLVEVDRIEDNEEETEYFFMGNDEDIVDTSWFSGAVLVTLAKTEWSKKFAKSPESTSGS